LTKHEAPPIEALLARFRQQASEADEQMVIDAAKSNAAGRKLWETCRELRKRGVYEAQMLELLCDLTPSVRAWAGGFCLEFAPERAVPVLEGEVELGGVAAIRARSALMLWRGGQLSFP
jgi:hypothetical protein